MRVRLFNKQFPHGKLFTSQAEVDQAMKDGWVDAEWKVDAIVVKPSPIDRDDDILDKPRIVQKPIVEEPIYKDNTPYNDKSKDGLKPCECGCGQMVSKRFALGHYQQMMKRLRKANGDSADSKQADTGGTI